MASTNRGAAFVRVNTVHVIDVSSITGPTKEMILLVSLLLSVLCMYIYVVCKATVIHTVLLARKLIY